MVQYYSDPSKIDVIKFLFRFLLVDANVTKRIISKLIYMNNSIYLINIYNKK